MADDNPITYNVSISSRNSTGLGSWLERVRRAMVANGNDDIRIDADGQRDVHWDRQVLPGTRSPHLGPGESDTDKPTSGTPSMRPGGR